MGHDLARVDLTDLDIFAGGFPHDIFRLHREQAPAWWHESTAHMPDGEGIWSVTTYDEVRQVLNNPPIYSSETGCDRPYGGTIFRTSPCPGPPPGHQRSDTGLPGARISPGQKVVVWEGSANRDPRRFDRPTRSSCRGSEPTSGLQSRRPLLSRRVSHPARIRAALEEALHAIDSFTRAGPEQWTRSNRHTGICHLPLRFTRRPQHRDQPPACDVADADTDAIHRLDPSLLERT
jgi:cytochrome P450